MTRKIQKAVEAVRLASGLPVYEGPLIAAVCEKCGRRYYFRVVPEVCVWPACDGLLKAEEDHG